MKNSKIFTWWPAGRVLARKKIDICWRIKLEPKPLVIVRLGWTPTQPFRRLKNFYTRYIIYILTGISYFLNQYVWTLIYIFWLHFHVLTGFEIEENRFPSIDFYYQLFLFKVNNEFWCNTGGYHGRLCSCKCDRIYFDTQYVVFLTVTDNRLDLWLFKFYWLEK